MLPDRLMPADPAVLAADSLQAEKVTVDFQGLRAVEAVTLDVQRGEILGLIGPNGAGKTTLVNVITGFQLPSSGVVRLSGTDVTGWPTWRRSRAGLGRTFQNVLLFPNLSAAENIEAGALAGGASRRDARLRAATLLDWLGLSVTAERQAGTLAFGAERLIGIGRAIAAQPRFLLMDEPAAGLNDAECIELASLIRRIRSELGCGIVLIEHRMSLVFAVCDRIHVLEQGRTLAIGRPSEIEGDARVRRAYLGEPA